MCMNGKYIHSQFINRFSRFLWCPVSQYQSNCIHFIALQWNGWHLHAFVLLYSSEITFDIEIDEHDSYQLNACNVPIHTLLHTKPNLLCKKHIFYFYIKIFNSVTHLLVDDYFVGIDLRSNAVKRDFSNSNTQTQCFYSTFYYTMMLSLCIVYVVVVIEWTKFDVCVLLNIYLNDLIT